MTIQLDRLEAVKLRNIWKTEDRDFTPWLAEEQNLKILADTIEMDLELEAQEKEVGPFRADILCKNTLDNSWVLIENQIERTDHKHLGQLLTYAAGLDAVTVVWIASKFTEEHRSALDWLNKITAQNFRFFGVEVQLWRIGTSKPAAKFNIISKPNDWNNRIARAARNIEEENLNDTQTLYLTYWTQLANYLENNSDLKLRSPSHNAWADFSMGRSNAILRISVSKQLKKITTSIILSKNMRQTYNQLLNQKDLIASYFRDASINETLEWENKPKKHSAVIKLECPADINITSDWNRQHKLFLKKIKTFQDIFKPLLRDL